MWISLWENKKMLNDLTPESLPTGAMIIKSQKNMIPGWKNDFQKFNVQRIKYEKELFGREFSLKEICIS